MRKTSSRLEEPSHKNCHRSVSSHPERAPSEKLRVSRCSQGGDSWNFKGTLIFQKISKNQHLSKAHSETTHSGTPTRMCFWSWQEEQQQQQNARPRGSGTGTVIHPGPGGTVTGVTWRELQARGLTKRSSQLGSEAQGTTSVSLSCCSVRNWLKKEKKSQQMSTTGLAAAVGSDGSQGCDSQ